MIPLRHGLLSRLRRSSSKSVASAPESNKFDLPITAIQSGSDTSATSNTPPSPRFAPSPPPSPPPTPPPSPPSPSAVLKPKPKSAKSHISRLFRKKKSKKNLSQSTSLPEISLNATQLTNPSAIKPTPKENRFPASKLIVQNASHPSAPILTQTPPEVPLISENNFSPALVSRSKSSPMPSASSTLRAVVLLPSCKKPHSVLLPNHLLMCCDIFDSLSSRPDVPIPDSFRSSRRVRKHTQTMSSLHILHIMRTLASNRAVSHPCRTFLKQAIGRFQLSDAYNMFDDLTFYEMIEVIEESVAMTLLMLQYEPHRAEEFLSPLWKACVESKSPAPSPTMKNNSHCDPGTPVFRQTDFWVSHRRSSFGASSVASSDTEFDVENAHTSVEDTNFKKRPSFDMITTVHSAPRHYLRTERSLQFPSSQFSAPAVCRRAMSMEVPHVKPDLSPVCEVEPDSLSNVERFTQFDGLRSRIKNTFEALAKGSSAGSIDRVRLENIVANLLARNPKTSFRLFLVEMAAVLDNCGIEATQGISSSEFETLVMRCSQTVRQVTTDETWNAGSCLSLLCAAAVAPRIVDTSPHRGTLMRSTDSTSSLSASSVRSPSLREVSFFHAPVIVARQHSHASILA